MHFTIVRITSQRARSLTPIFFEKPNNSTDVLGAPTL